MPQSIHFPQNLLALQLVDCELTGVPASGELQKLEILHLLGSKIKELPREIGNPGYLELLDFTRCFDLQ